MQWVSYQNHNKKKKKKKLFTGEGYIRIGPDALTTKFWQFWVKTIQFNIKWVGFIDNNQ